MHFSLVFNKIFIYFCNENNLQKSIMKKVILVLSLLVICIVACGQTLHSKKVVDTVYVEVFYPNSLIVYFDENSTRISEKEYLHIDFFVDGVESIEECYLTIFGSADTSTGTLRQNEKLAKKRAEKVKKILVNDYGFIEKNLSVEVILDMCEFPEKSRCVIVE